MSLWSSLQAVIAPESDAPLSAREQHRVDDDDDNGVDLGTVDAPQLRQQLSVERRSAQALSEALDRERESHRAELRALKELLKEKEAELDALERPAPAAPAAELELQRRLSAVQRDQLRSASLHDAFVGAVAKAAQLAPSTDERTLLAAIERLATERAATDRSAELKLRNETLARQLKDCMAKLKAASEAQAQLEATRAAETNGQVDRLRAELDAALRDVDEAREREKQAESEAMVLRQELQQSVREAERLRHHLLQQEEAAEHAEAQLADLQARAAALRDVASVVEQRDAEIAELRRALRDKDGEATLLSKAVVDLQSALESVQTESNLQLQAELGEMATRLALASGRVAALEVLEQRHATLQAECESLHARLLAQADELANARADAQRAVGDASTLQYAVEKLVSQVDLLSQNEVRMVSRERMKQLVLQICTGGTSARRAALEAVASICAMSVDEQKQVGLITSSWFDTGASTFVAFLENSVLEEQVNELQEEEKREQAKSQGKAAEI